MSSRYDACPECGSDKLKFARLCRACFDTSRKAQHGTSGMYSNHGCRCDACREANRIKTLEYFHRTGRTRPQGEVFAERRAAAEARDNHGTETRYNHLGCRCRACRDAVASARRLRRQRGTTMTGHRSSPESDSGGAA